MIDAYLQQNECINSISLILTSSYYIIGLYSEVVNDLNDVNIVICP